MKSFVYFIELTYYSTQLHLFYAKQLLTDPALAMSHHSTVMMRMCMSMHVHQTIVHMAKIN